MKSPVQFFAKAIMLSFLLLFACSSATSTGQETERQYSVTSINYESEGVNIAAELWLPEGAGPHPAIAMAHGSGRARKEYGNEMAMHFVRQGYAVLTHDKRGVGGSGGEYVQRMNASEGNLNLLAKDISAGIDFLKKRPDIDQHQIGLWGWSQAGWIIPIVTVLQENIKFTILLSGPTVTVGEENVYSRLTGDGSQDSGLTQQEMSAKLEESGPFGFDPIPYLKQMSMPGLWLLGENDQSIPIPETVKILDRLIGTYKRDFTYKLYPGAGHGLRVNGAKVPDFWQVQDDFLKNKVQIKVR